MLEGPKAPIVISYRDEGNGGGAFYDHYTMQRITKYPTEIARSDRMDRSALRAYAKESTFTIQGEVDATIGKTLPPLWDPESTGLLFIPGRSHEIETKRRGVHEIRTAYEKGLVRDALNRGRPILAVCAGSWLLWESLGNNQIFPGQQQTTTIDVDDHTYGGGMPRIGTSGNIGYNKQIHSIQIVPNSNLAQIMQIPNQQGAIPVNSVHWRAASSNVIPDFVEIGARTVQDDSIAPSNRQGSQMKPTDNTIEAFTNRLSGSAPFIGCQYHPEAYNRNDSSDLFPQFHHRVLLYMAKAGDAYQAKQKMLRQLKSDVTLLPAHQGTQDPDVDTLERLLIRVTL